MNINPVNYSVSSKGKATKDVKLINNKIARLITETNDKNEFTFLEVMIGNKGKDGKLLLNVKDGNYAGVGRKSGLTPEDKSKFANNVVGIIGRISEETAKFMPTAELRTGIMNAETFLKDFIVAILR